MIVKKFVVFTLIGILVATSAYSQDKQELAKSDFLFNSANKLCNEGKYEMAIRLGTEALEIMERELGKEDPDYADALNNVALYHFKSGEYAEAIRLGTEALEIMGRVLGKGDPKYAIALGNLALYKSYLGDNAEAIRLGTEALEIMESKLGKENYNYATSLNNLALFKSSLGEYAEADSLGTEALEIMGRVSVSGKEHPDYANALNNLALCKSYLGNHAEAIRLGTEALGIMERVLGKKNSNYATSLNNIAMYNAYLGNYDEALRMGTEALKIWEQLYGKGHSDYATALNNVALCNSYLGDYTEAIRLGTEALEIMGRVLGKENSNYANALNGLALYKSYLGDYAEAIRLGTEALEIMGRVLGKENSNYALSLNNLAFYKSCLGDYAEAIRLGTEALEIYEKIYDKEHPNYANTLNNIATYNCSLGNYAEAIRLGTEALEIWGSVLGKEHPNYALSLNNVAWCKSYLGEYIEAIRLGTEALKIWEQLYGKGHPNYAMFLNNLAEDNAYLGHYSEVSNCVMESTHLQSQIILNTFSDLTTNERTLFWNKYKDWFEGSLPQYAYYLQTDSLIATTYDGALLSKGLLLNTEIGMNKLLQDSGNTAVDSKYQRLQTNKAMINKLQERFATQYNTNDTLTLRNNIDSLRNVVQLQELELVQLSKTYGDYTKNLSINWHDVQEKLGKDDVAIEFLSFPVRNDSIMYVALTLTKDDDVPHMTSLFEKKELNKLNPKDYYNTTKLTELVWAPLSDVLKDKKNVYFSPAGELYNIAIESIPYYDGEGLMSDPEHWNMYRLSSTRNLALIKDKYDIKSADVYGGLKYDMTKAAIEESGENSSTGEVQYEVRAIADSLSLRGGIEIPPRTLPATKIEAEDVEKILVTMDVDSKLYTDTLGTETSFKALSGNKTNLLHIATHGFYWTDTEAKNMGDLSFLTPLNYDASPRYVEDKALTRTGLIFAGASYALEGNPLPEGVNDGILTAREISILDLRGLDLVVLSACQTGLGEITGDGVFGLQRGFKKAGANTIMMSLWEVNDEATQLLVSEFYNNLAQGKSKYDALREAQQFVRDYEIEETITTNDNLTAHQRRQLEHEHKSIEVQTTTRKVKPYASPKFWAAFILLDAID